MAWPGIWPWLAPLLLFLLWAGVGILLSRDFYEQVVLREFLGRFQTGEHAVHQPRNPFFYAGLLLLRWQPWGILLAMVFALRAVRSRLRSDPALLWLACWGFGGLVLMSLIPSKRFDRILPALPPLCLLLPALIPRLAADRFRPEKLRRAAYASIAGAALFSTAYAVSKACWAYSRKQRGLVDLGETALRLAGGNPRQIGVVRGGDEGLLLYTRQTRFLSEESACKAWNRGSLRFLVLPEKARASALPRLENARCVAETGRIDGKASAYMLLEKTGP
jgi:hypothetical protein